MTDQPETEATDLDTCRPVQVDGGTIRVRGSGEMTEEALTALVRVAKSKFTDEAPQQVGMLQNRLRRAHEARRAKEHQLDGIRRALCDAGFMEDDDPYGHADLPDVIRQAGQLSASLRASNPAVPIADALAAEAHRRSQRLKVLKMDFSVRVSVRDEVYGEVIGLRRAVGIALGGVVEGGLADRLGSVYCRDWVRRNTDLEEDAAGQMEEAQGGRA